MKTLVAFLLSFASTISAQTLPSWNESDAKARIVAFVQAITDKKSKTPNANAALVVMEETKKRKVLIGKGGLWGNVIRTGMMLNATKAHVDEMVEAIDAGLTIAAKN